MTGLPSGSMYGAPFPPVYLCPVSRPCGYALVGAVLVGEGPLAPFGIIINGPVSCPTIVAAGRLVQVEVKLEVQVEVLI